MNESDWLMNAISKLCDGCTELSDHEGSMTLRLQCDLCGGCRSVCTIIHDLHETIEACDILSFV
jgi:ABC-type hemin transport system ATPase subunit